MFSPVAHQRHLIVKPDLPVDTERQLRSGLWAPAQYRAERWRGTKAAEMTFAKSDLQVVSGTVVASPPSLQRTVKSNPGTAKSVGGILRHVGGSRFDLVMDYPAPMVGDKVWIGYGAWGRAEASGHVFMLGDDLLGRIHASDIFMHGTDGDWKTSGPWVVCEPVPPRVPEKNGMSKGLLGMIPNRGYVRVVPPFGQIEVNGLLGMEVIFTGASKAAYPVPFAETEWYRIPLDEIVCVVGDSPAPDKIKEAWDSMWAHNAEISRYAKDIFVEGDVEEIQKQEALERVEAMERSARRYHKTRIFHGADFSH